MPRVTSLPSPAVAGPRIQPTLYWLPPARFSLRQARLLCQVPAWLLGTILILAHTENCCQVFVCTRRLVRCFLNQEIATPRQVGARNDGPVGARIPGAPYQSGLLQIRYHCARVVRGRSAGGGEHPFLSRARSRR